MTNPPQAAGSADEDDASPDPTPDRHDAPPEPDQEGGPDAGAAAAHEKLALANEVLLMETLDLLDGLQELSRGVLKPQAAMLAVLEADRRAGVLPEDGGSTLQQLVGKYKERSGNPEGKSIHRNIADWEAARDAVLEAKFALLETEEQRAAGEEGKQGGEPGFNAEEDNEPDLRVLGERRQKALGGGDPKDVGEKIDSKGLNSVEAETGADSDKENDPGLELNGDPDSAKKRGVFTENGQDGEESAGQESTEKESRGGETKKSGAKQSRLLSTGSDGGNGFSNESELVTAPGEVTEKSAEKAADGAKKGSLIPLPPHLRAQAPRDV